MSVWHLHRLARQSDLASNLTRSARSFRDAAVGPKWIVAAVPYSGPRLHRPRNGKVAPDSGATRDIASPGCIWSRVRSDSCLHLHDNLAGRLIRFHQPLGFTNLI